MGIRVDLARDARSQRTMMVINPACDKCQEMTPLTEASVVVKPDGSYHVLCVSHQLLYPELNERYRLMHLLIHGLQTQIRSPLQ